MKKKVLLMILNNMLSQNPWVTYLHRGYKSIKAALINRMQSVTPEITDYSDSNIFVIIIDLFAGLVEQINYYIDNMARESYITTARRYSSIIKLTRLIDYRVRANIGATVDILVTAKLSGSTHNVTSNVTCNIGMIIETGENIRFITQQSKTIVIGTSSVLIPAKQRILITNNNIGTTTSSPDQTYQLEAGYQHDTLQITINSVTWELQDSLAFAGPQDKYFIIEVNESKEKYISLS